MQEPILSPDISILIDEQVLQTAYTTVNAANKVIAAENERVKGIKATIEQALDRVARKLLANPACGDQLDEVEINSHDFTIDNYNNAEICFSYSFKESDSEVTVYTWDSYDGGYDREIMTFPLSFVHRADWLANLEVWVEAAAMKALREEQEAVVEQEQHELSLLRELMEKHQGKL